VERREFIMLLGGAAAWPLAARAQQPTMPTIGLLGTGSPEAYAHHMVAFRQGLREAGYVQGDNVTLEFRWAEGQFDRLPALAADLVDRQVAVIATSGGNASATAAKRATNTIPIVFVSGGDPVKLGLVASLNKPGGNVTGASRLSTELGAKRLGVLQELVPGAALVAIFINPDNAVAPFATKDAEEAISTIGKRLVVQEARTEREIDVAFVTLVQQRVGALLVTPDPFFMSRRKQIITLAARNAVPTMYGEREFVDDGGLVSYSTSVSDAYRQAGIYAGLILRGAKPADLPVQQPTKLELVINLQTANTLGLKIPPTLLALADEVIE
jgi:putative ABC transport system substrate-binding protein